MGCRCLKNFFISKSFEFSQFHENNFSAAKDSSNLSKDKLFIKFGFVKFIIENLFNFLSKIDDKYLKLDLHPTHGTEDSHIPRG